MSANVERRRVLLAVAGRVREELARLFAGEALAGWEVLEVESFERARFALQTEACDVLLIDGSLYGPGAGAGLAWLAEHTDAPVLLLADAGALVALDALRHGAHGWLPRALAFEHPALLDASLRRSAQIGDLLRRAEVANAALRDCHGRVNRLLTLLWEAAPGQGPTRWFSQRYMLERLEEEMARARRHGGPLTVVLGEVQPVEGEPVAADEAMRLASWAAGRVGRSKRRSDVAGQYGLHGFMLLLPRVDGPEALGCCHRLRRLLEQPSAADGPFPPLRACFGVASVGPGVTTVSALLGRAEAGLERAKDKPEAS
jgi:diguanylate cyclase (GGDEF)-like protein